MKVIRNEALPQRNNSLEFEGADFGDVGVSFFWVDAAPGRGPSLHTHEHPTLRGDRSRQVNIHANPRFVTQWLEDEDYG